MSGANSDTQKRDYTERLARLETVWWKRVLDVQAPYRWNIRRLEPGFVLDLGCGLGRHLANLKGNGVGIDHNPHSIALARSRGLQAFTPEEFLHSPFNAPNSFDSILLSHVAEHMTASEVVRLLGKYVPNLRLQGLVILIAPQARGYRSDPTHVQFLGFDELRAIACAVGLTPIREYSFPFPRFLGHLFKHNEFVSVHRRPA